MIYINDILRIFATWQIFYYLFLWKYGIKWRRFWVERIQFKWFLFEIQKYYFVFYSRFFVLLCFFFSNGHIQNIVSTLPNVKMDFENDNVISTLSNVVEINVEIENVKVVQRCKFQHWCPQRSFKVDLTLCYFVTSYQPKINIETTLK